MGRSMGKFQGPVFASWSCAVGLELADAENFLFPVE